MGAKKVFVITDYFRAAKSNADVEFQPGRDAPAATRATECRGSRRSMPNESSRCLDEIRRRRRQFNAAKPTPSDMRAQAAGSGTMLMEPVAGLNVADCPAARPVTFTLEN